jgi:CysZ protein
MWQYLFFIIIFFVSFLGWQDPKSSPVFYLIFVIAFYYYGFSFIDYINERRKLDIDQSVQFVRHHWGLALALGAVYSCMILVPVDLGVIFSLTGFGDKNFFLSAGELILHILLWVAASAAPILAIVASTIAMNDLVGLKRKR